MMSNDRIAEAILIGLVLLAPLPLGAVQPASLLALSAAAATAAWLVLPRRGLQSAETARPRWTFAAVAAVALVPLVPLPAGFASLISPAAAALRAAIPGRPAGAWSALGIHPEATSLAVAKVMVYAALFLVAACLARTGSTRRILAALVGSGLFQAAYGSAEYLSGRQQIFWYAKRYYTEDATGTFINKNHLAGLLEMALPVGVGFLLLQAQHRSPASDRPGLRARLIRLGEEDGARTVLLAVGVAVLALGLLLSHSRSGLACAGVAVTLVVGIATRREGAGRISRLIFVAGGALLAVLFMTGIERVLMGPSRLVAGMALERGRIPVWIDSLAVFTRFPVFGTGLGSFADIYPLYRTELGGFLYDHAHNDYLEILVETGLVGGVVAALLLLSLTRRVIRGLGSVSSSDFPVLLGASGGVLALLLHEMTDFNLQIPANAAIFAILAGTLSGSMQGRPRRLLLMDGPTAGLRAPSEAAPGRAARTAGIIAVCLVTAASYRMLRQDRAVRLLAEARMPQDSSVQGTDRAAAAERVRILRAAIALRSVSAKARSALALEIARAAGEAGVQTAPAAGSAESMRSSKDEEARRPDPRFREALGQIASALDANPTDEDAWIAGFRVATLASLIGAQEAGSEELARKYLDGAIRSDPASGYLRKKVAEALLAAGDQGGALEQYTLAMRDPSVNRDETVRQMLDLGFPPDAIVAAVPQGFNDLYATAILLVNAGRGEAAERALLAAGERDPSSHLPSLSLARLLEAEGRPMEALQYARQALDRFRSLQPADRADLLFSAAIASASMGRSRESLDYAREALAISPRLAPLRDLAARMLLATGDPQGALEQWGFILAHLQGDPWFRQNRLGLHRHLGSTCDALGMRGPALEQYLELLRLSPDDAEARKAVERLSTGG